MPQGVFGNVIRNLDQMGVTDVVLPFLLVFVIIYAALRKTGVLHKRTAGQESTENTGFDITVALVIGLLVVIPHVAFGTVDPSDGRLGGAMMGLPDVVEIFNNSLPSISVWIIGILMLMLLTGMFMGPAIKDQLGRYSWIILAAAVVIVGYIFGSSAGIFRELPAPLRFLQTPANQAALLIILVFGIVIYLIVRGDTGGNNRDQQNQPNQPNV
ncbi:hypothetical protein KY326_02960 [Candidatus Woesearchaeota archaeon]|nr:hypothetical protein [Candidatus Woesearchaeota archaeon]